jgi:hypothetical protein
MERNGLKIKLVLLVLTQVIATLTLLKNQNPMEAGSMLEDMETQFMNRSLSVKAEDITIRAKNMSFYFTLRIQFI